MFGGRGKAVMVKVRALSELNTTLLAALRAGAEPEAVFALLDAGADPNCAVPAGEGGYHALHIAASMPDDPAPEFSAPEGRRAELVSALLARRANPNATANGGQTPLLVALGSSAWIGNRDTATIQVLLDAGADPSRANALGHTPLMTAIVEPCLDLLLDAGADPGAIDRDGWSALEWAAILRPPEQRLMDAVGRKIPGKSEKALDAFVKRETPLEFDPGAFSQAAETMSLAQPVDAARAADYLAAGYPLLEYGRRDDNVLTDGQWAWREAMSDKVRQGESLPARLLERLGACGYRMPFLDPLKLWAKTWLSISDATYVMKPRSRYLHRYFCNLG
jgi:hypothetical protein